MRRAALAGRVDTTTGRRDGSFGIRRGLHPREMIFDACEPASHCQRVPAKRIGGCRALTECLNLSTQVVDLGLEVAVEHFLMEKHGSEESAHQATGQTKHTLRPLRIVDARVVKGEVSHEKSGLLAGNQDRVPNPARDTH